MIFIPFLQSVSVAPRSSNMLMTIAPFGLIILIFYFFIIRRQNDVSLEDAFKCFEEGTKLACELEKEIDRIEGKIQ
ncbi:exodeoxyribonuclease VII small subunit, partial [Treponema endosymbiont of Eucomonympha sp.]|uniref:exodeoxyribonuclease VII small subunit n=1 Tax=Treponema endosymbiont of Eucomonympha sp. TaxID=1580831 RepID=UPI000B16FF37